MRQVTRKGLMTVAAATGVLAVTGGSAVADSGANGSASDSPGFLSGNSVQAPVHLPVNVCGNTANVIGLLNPAVGNECAGQGGGSGSGTASDGGAQAVGSTSDSSGIASGNQAQVPVNVPVDVCGNSVNLGGLGNATADNGCGNLPGGKASDGNETGNETGGNASDGSGTDGSGTDGDETAPAGSGEAASPGVPGDPETPGRGLGEPQEPVSFGDDNPSGADGHYTDTLADPQSNGTAQLAQTGSEVPLGLVLPVGAGALLMGAVLYRKARASM